MFGVLIPVYEHAMDVTEDELTASMTRLSHHWGPIMVTAQMILVCSTPRAQSCNKGTKYWLNNTQISKSSFTHLIWAIFICLIFEFSCFLCHFETKNHVLCYILSFNWLLSIIIPFYPVTHIIFSFSVSPARGRRRASDRGRHVAGRPQPARTAAPAVEAPRPSESQPLAASSAPDSGR